MSRNEEIDVWKVSMDGSYCVCLTKEDAIQTAGEEYVESGEAVLTEERMTRAEFDALPEFDGF